MKWYLMVTIWDEERECFLEEIEINVDAPVEWLAKWAARTEAQNVYPDLNSNAFRIAKCQINATMKENAA